jgi:predicted phosphodiesterase
MAVAAGLTAASGASAAPRKAAGALLKGPYLQNVTPTAVTIMWQNDRTVGGTLTVQGAGEDRAIEVDACRICEVVVDGLTPSRRYAYRVAVAGDGPEAQVPAAGRAGEFATSPAAGADVPVTFIVYGDTRQYTENHRRVVQRAATEVPDFLLATGDMVDEGSKLDEWQTFFDVESDLIRDNVLYPALGNHDRQGRGRTADTYRQFFSLPENSPNPEREYAFTFARVRVVVLDSNASSFALTDQTAWLERELIAARQDAAIDHVFVVMHHPPYSISLHGGQRELREMWTPLFERYGVAAVFSGHDHVYSRAEVNGIRYFVSGGGGAPLYPRSQRASERDKAAVKAFERVNHYLRVQVRGAQIEIAAIRVDGTTIESIGWQDESVARRKGPPAAPAAEAPPAAAPPVVPAVGAGAPAALPAPPRRPPADDASPWLLLGGGGVSVALLISLWAARRRR